MTVKCKNNGIFDAKSFVCKDCDEWGGCAWKHPEQFKPKEKENEQRRK